MESLPDQPNTGPPKHTVTLCHTDIVQPWRKVYMTLAQSVSVLLLFIKASRCHLSHGLAFYRDGA